MFKRASIADSTLKLRISQWRCYKRYCQRFKLAVVPCDDDQLSLYCSFMSEYLSYASIVSYCQSVIFWHKYFGLVPPSTSSPEVQFTLLGVKRIGPLGPKPREPFMPNHLRAIHEVLDLTSMKSALFWASVLLMFRTLLRVSHVTPSPHTLGARDFVFKDWGVIVNVSTSKTSQYRGGKISLPVASISQADFCPVFWVRRCIDRLHRLPEDLMFAVPSSYGFSYSTYNKFFQSTVESAAISEYLTPHSLRKGGATYLSSMGVPLDQIRSRGQWKSDSIFRYLQLPLRDRISKEKIFSSSLSFPL